MTNPSPIPPVVGRYEVVRELGRGAMGVVYEARDPSLSRTIALKVILPAPPGEKESFEERFFHEARIAARLAHPGIVVVHDVGRDPASGILYIALEHLKGRTLAEVVDNGPLDWREACRLGAQMARALHHAHLQGVVHRDMKPANVMLLPTGETKIMDFGIARIETARFHTNPGEFVGTPLYSAPEQAQDGELDGRTDVFALGSIVYTLLTGQPAFAAARIPEIVHRVIHHDPPPPSRLVPGIPVYLDRLVSRAMAKDPGHRYPDAQTLAADFESILAGRPPAHAGETARVRIAASASPVVPPEPRPALDLVPEDSLDLQLTALVEGPAPEGRGSASQSSSATSMASAVPIVPVAASSASAPWSASSPSSASLPPTPELPAPAASKGRRRFAVLLVGGLLLGGFAIGYVVVGLRDEPMPVARPATTPKPATPPAAAPADPDSPAGGPEAEASPEPSRAPRAPPPRGTRSSGPGEPGRLRIEFDHPLKQGVLRVWVDGAPVIAEKLAGTVQKKALVFRMSRGTFEEDLQVSPGPHTIRFEVTWDDNVKTEEIGGTFRPGETRTLEADLGRIRKGLDLSWK